MNYIEKLVKRYPVLTDISVNIQEAYELMKSCYEMEGKLLIAGNGGSAADAEHITGELMKGFKLRRQVPKSMADSMERIDKDRGSKLAKCLQRALPAIPLVDKEAFLTAYINDVGSDSIFAQQIYGYGRQGDVFLAISTSGNSTNILDAAVVAKAMEMKVIGLTGQGGGKLAELADVMVAVPERETYLIQELHLPIYHCWCMMLEEFFFGESDER